MRLGVGVGDGFGDGVEAGEEVGAAVKVVDGVGAAVARGAHAVATMSATRSLRIELP